MVGQAKPVETCDKLCVGFIKAVAVRCWALTETVAGKQSNQACGGKTGRMQSGPKFANPRLDLGIPQGRIQSGLSIVQRKLELRSLPENRHAREPTCSRGSDNV